MTNTYETPHYNTIGMF